MKQEKQGRNKISKVDIIVIAGSIVAVIFLAVLLIFSKNQQKNKQKMLENLEEQDLVQMQKKVSVEYSDLIINEVNQDGWIELYNNGSDELELGQCAVYKEGVNVYTVEEGTKISPQDRTVIETDGKISDDKATVISLYDKDGLCIASELVPKLAGGESYGCVTDGSSEKSYLTASKNEENTDDKKLSKSKLEFSVPGGFYDETVMLSLTSDENLDIYYTTDGTEPTTESDKYTSQIKISNKSGSEYTYAASDGIGYYSEYRPSRITMGTVVKAIAVDADGKTVAEKSQTFFVKIRLNNEVINQPVVSITVNPDDLFDYFNGMYIYGRTYEDALAKGEDTTQKANYYNGWVKNAYVEFFDADKSKTYEGEVKLSMLKDSSLKTPQRGFFIDNISASKGSELYKYTFNNNSNLNLQTYKRDNDGRMRETLINELVSGTAVGINDFESCAVFIEGEYWGNYMLRAVCDEKYISSNYGVDSPVIIYQNKKINDSRYENVFNDFEQFVKNTDMSVSENYGRLQEMMDVQSYIDYLCTNMYFANPEYGNEEAAMWRSTEVSDGKYSDGKWRFVLGKMDMSLANSVSDGLSSPTIDSFLMPAVNNDWILQSLMKNDDFKAQLKKTMKDMVENIFTEDNVKNALDSVSGQMKKTAVSTYDRFISSAGEALFEEDKDNIGSYFDTRNEFILKYTEEFVQ